MEQLITFFDKQVIVPFLFFDSYDHVFTRKVFGIAIQKKLLHCLIKILSMTVFTTVYHIIIMIFIILQTMLTQSLQVKE